MKSRLQPELAQTLTKKEKERSGGGAVEEEKEEVRYSESTVSVLGALGTHSTHANEEVQSNTIEKPEHANRVYAASSPTRMIATANLKDKTNGRDRTGKGGSRVWVGREVVLPKYLQRRRSAARP